jgi:diacylglycerol kinase (ATP)
MGDVITTNAGLVGLQRALVVANPVATGVSDDLVDAVIDRCSGHIEELETVRTAPPGSGEDPVVDALTGGSPVNLVLAVGGDGTVRAAAEAIARAHGGWPHGGVAASAPALAIVPKGSGNSAYQALWGDRSAEEALDIVLGAGACDLRMLDLIRRDGSDEPSLLGVNTGLVAQVAAAVDEAKAREPEAGDDEQRYANAFVEVIQEFSPFPTVVTVDGRVIFEGPTTFVSVGGVRSFGGGSFKLLPRSELDDGLLDVCAVPGTTDQALFQEVAAQVLAGEHLSRPEVGYAQGRRVTIERTDGEPLAMEHDGDPHPAGTTLAIEIVPSAVPALAAPRLSA